MLWWGDPHRLYVVARAHDGAPLAIRGPRVEDFSTDRADSPLAPFDHRITFLNEFAVDASSEAFVLEILGSAAEPIERLEMTYVPQRCMCASYDSL